MQPVKQVNVHELAETPEDKAEDEENEAAAKHKGLIRPKRSHRRSYSDISQVFKSPNKVLVIIVLIIITAFIQWICLKSPHVAETRWKTV